MATIDSRYIQATILQHVFRDKDTGLPLADGEIWFYRDTDRIDLKSVFQFAGTPDPVFTELPNPMPLTGIGTASDGFNNDILFYYLPEDENGDIDRYFLEVWSSPGKLGGGVLQFTREAQPTVSEEDEVDDNFVNYASNSQFLMHVDLPELGEITQAITDVAYGGWTWERPPSSTATDLITFVRFSSFIEQPESNPRYAIRCNTTVPDPSDLFKDLRYKIKDVNFFASDDEEITLQIEAESLTGGPTNVELLIIKNFGTGGSATTETPITTFTIEPGYQKFTVTFVMGDNDGETIGNLDNDFVQLAFRFPSALVNDITITNVLIRDGDYSLLKAPLLSYAQQQEQAMGGSLPIPDYVSTDIGKSVTLTLGGYEYSSSAIGRGVVTGCLVANDASDLNLNIAFNPGTVHSQTQVLITLNTVLRKEINNTWAEGDLAGGLFAGTVANDLTYHLFLILKDNSTIVDAGFDTDVDAANIPTGYTHFARVGSLKTDDSGNLYQFIQDPFQPELFELKNQIFVSTVTDNAGATSDIFVPQGIPFLARIGIDAVNLENSSALHVRISSISQDNDAPTGDDNTMAINIADGSTGNDNRSAVDLAIMTDSLSLIRHRVSYGAPNNQIRMFLHGWWDKRGNI